MAEPAGRRITDTGVSWVRTRLAWSRTVLTLSVTALLAARFAIRHGLAGAAFVAVALAGWAAASLWMVHRVRQLAGPSRVRPPTIVGAAVMCVAYAILGLVMLAVL